MVDLRPLRPALAYRNTEAIGQFSTGTFQRRDFLEPTDSVRESRSGDSGVSLRHSGPAEHHGRAIPGCTVRHLSLGEA